MSDATYLPPGFPSPDREAMARLRENVMLRTKTKHPPEPAELAVLVAADEAGVDLAAVDAEEVWAQPPADRARLFELIGALVAEMAG